jgi:hypothetical protein
MWDSAGDAQPVNPERRIAPYARGPPRNAVIPLVPRGPVDERGRARQRPAAAAAGGGCGSDAARRIRGGLPRLAVRHRSGDAPRLCLGSADPARWRARPPWRALGQGLRRDGGITGPARAPDVHGGAPAGRADRAPGATRGGLSLLADQCKTGVRQHRGLHRLSWLRARCDGGSPDCPASHPRQEGGGAGELRQVAFPGDDEP